MSVRSRVLIVDDHSIVAEALRSMLGEHDDMEVVGTANNGFEAERMARDLVPDVILMDVAMPELNGIDATLRIQSILPDCKVLVLSMHSDNAHVRAAFKAGASGYILKRTAARDALAAIRAVRAGTSYIDPAISANMIGLLNVKTDEDPLATLSRREREVLQLLSESHTITDIAVRLSLSPKTIETYRSRLMEKLDIHDLPGLVRFAIRHGLIKLD